MCELLQAPDRHKHATRYAFFSSSKKHVVHSALKRTHTFRLPVRLSTPRSPDRAAPTKEYAAAAAPAPSMYDQPAQNMNSGPATTPAKAQSGLHRVVYARKGPKSLRWVSGFVSVDNLGQARLLSDSKKHIDTQKDVWQASIQHTSTCSLQSLDLCIPFDDDQALRTHRSPWTTNLTSARTLRW
jgi:hypothetical protein